MDANRTGGTATKPPYKAKAIANYFIGRADEEGIRMTNMKLQKLVYFAHGWHLALANAPLIDERVQAWEFGPVVRTIYDEFKEYGKDPITRKGKSFEVQGLKFAFVVHEVPESDGQTHRLLARIWDVYKGFSAFQLSDLTHRNGTPWEKTYPPNANVRNLAIDDVTITEYFKKAVEENRAKSAAT